MKSTLFTLNSRDFFRGLIMAVAVPVLLIIQQSIAAGGVVFNWPDIWKAALAGGIAYLLKNFLTDDTAAAVKTLEKQNVTIIDRSPNKEPGF